MTVGSTRLDKEMSEESSKQGIGARVLRKEDYRHTRGLGNFIADMKFPRLTEVAFLRSPLAHARILSTAKPDGYERRVFFREDLSSVKPIRSVMKLPGFRSSEQHPLAFEKVRFVGEPVAMCLGVSRAEAEDVAELLTVEYEELPAVVNAKSVLNGQPGPYLHEEWDSHIILDTFIDKGLEEGVKDAPIVVKRSYDMGRQAVNSLEGKAVLAHWDHQKNQLVVYTSTQVPHMIRSALAEHLGLAEHEVRVIAPDVGGGFGLKCVLQTEELCIAWLALTFKKPFRWIEDRREHLTSGANCREHLYEITAYADETGRLIGIDAQVTVDAGAYSVWPFSSCLEATMAASHLPGPYRFPFYRVRTRSIATNKPSIVPYRGVARTGINFAMELTIDAIAREIGREAWEVRRDNLVTKAEMPWTNPVGRVLDSGDYPLSLQTTVDAIDVGKVRKMQAEAAGSGCLIGVGFANYIEMTAHGTRAFVGAGMPFTPGAEPATVRVTPDGGVEIRVGVQSHGQGMETSLAQIAHEVLGVDIKKMSVVHGDTELTPFSTGTYASRSITMAGGAVGEACKTLAARLGKIAAYLLQANQDDLELRDGSFHTASNSMSIGELARIWYTKPEMLSNELSLDSLELTGMYRPTTDNGQYSYGSHGAVVAIEIATGKVELLDYVITEDCGVRVNPMIVEGQTYGGAAQGIGTALYEEMEYDESGQPLASTLADYLLPGAAEIPNVRLFDIVTPSPNTSFGIKGAGEGGAIPPPSAIFNAVNDALAKAKVEVNTTPLSPRRLYSAIAAWQAKSSEVAA